MNVTGARAVAVADLNRDGKLDLAVSAGFALTLFTYIGNGDGTYQAPQATTASLPGRPATLWLSAISTSIANLMWW